MVGDTKVAKRYAAALFGAVEKTDGGIEAAAADLTVIAEMLQSVPYLRVVLMQPLVSDERKRKVVADAFQSRLGPATFGLLNLLIRKRRETIIDDVIAVFRRLADEKAGVVDAFLESAIPLVPEQLDRIEKALSERTGKTIRLNSAVNPAMIGGLRVRIGDDVIDASLQTKLERLRYKLTAAR